MTAPRVYRCDGIVLHRTRLGEADMILTLFTPYRGKLRVIARGVRRPGSKMGGHLDLLTYSTLLLARAQNLDVVTQAQTRESFLALRDDLARTAAGLYAAELVERFTEEQGDLLPVFRLFLETLRRLSETRELGLVLRHFEVSLLDHLGFRPQTDVCVLCGGSPEAEGRSFSASAGGVLCAECAATEQMARLLSGGSLQALRFLQRATAAQAERAQVSLEVREELERLLREYIGFVLEREVRSAAFLRELGADFPA